MNHPNSSLRRQNSGPALVLALAVAALPAFGGTEEIDIPYSRHVLDNGLTLIVHEDDKAPIVAVNVWYHVGSKNEKRGKTGFAHLFEHLMFNGSENFDDDYFGPFERVGATDMNGTTNSDRTNYFQNVPKTAIDLALWMESDRMGHLLGAVTQEKLDEQRGVVQNEKRQGESQPYGKVFRTIVENTYPQGHPYSWSTIGSMEDLDAASLEDVHEWFKAFYGAANAVIAVVGDVDTEDIVRRAEAFFGDIAPGPPVERQEAWIAARQGTHRQAIEDRVPQARVIKVWNVPQWGTAEGDYLDLAADILATGKTSRLYKRLVYDDQIATDVVGFAWLKEISGQLVLWATARPGQDLATVEAAMDEELERFLAEGPTADELRRVQVESRAEFVRGIERIGGFGGKSDILAMNEVYGGSPDFYKTTLERQAEATVEDVHQTAREWLSDGAYVLEVRPFPDLAAAEESSVDRSGVPEVTTFPEVEFPELQRATLSNGLDVILVERHAVPTVDLDLLLDAGYAADQLGVPGTASLAMNMLDEGTTSRSSLEISEQLALLGAELSSGSDLDTSTVSLSALTENLDASLDVFADVVLNPAFAETELERLRQQQLAGIQREKVTPVQMALRVFPGLLYGDGHAYGLPLTGSGTEDSVAGLGRDDLVRFHGTWFKPNNATIVVVGDTTMDELTAKLEERFGDWPAGDVPEKNIGPVELPAERTLYLVDRPGSSQSVIFAGHVVPPKANPDEIAFEAVNDVLGGTFTARINMNLREDKHWSYGAFTFIPDARGQRPLIAYAPVQTDKTMESLRELQMELDGIVGDRPPTADELAKVKGRSTLRLPGRWETNAAVASSISDIVRFGLADDYWRSYPAEVNGLALEQIRTIAKNNVHPGAAVWVVVGDRAAIEGGLRQLDWGEIRLIDADGDPVSP